MVLKEKENDKVEFKREDNGKLNKEVVAFANTHGGILYVGVEDDGEVVGLEDADGKVESFNSMIRDSITPDLTFCTDVSKSNLSDKEIVKITVQCGGKKPYYIKSKGLTPSGVYVRQGASSVPASDDAIRTMIRETDGSIFEKMRSIQQNLTFVYATQKFEQHGLGLDVSKMITLGLMSEDKVYTNMGLLLSDQCPHTIKCGIYEGNTKAKFRKRMEFEGSILKQLDDVYHSLDLINPLVSTFKGLVREDTQGYPAQALREVLVNAVVHRDYDFTGPILLHVYDSKIEVVSLGGLPHGITEETLRNGVSQARNTGLANLFFRLRMIESYGTGIDRIYESYSDTEHTPEFSITGSSFLVMLPNKAVEIPREKAVLSPEPESLKKLFYEKKILSRREIEILLGCSAFVATRLLKDLISQSFVEKIPAGPNTKYKVVEK